MQQETGRIAVLFALLPLIIGGFSSCKRYPPGTVRLEKLGLDEEDDRIHFEAGQEALPEVGAEYFLVVTDLGTCLECKKAAIWVSRIWRDGARPGRLVFLDTLQSEFDRQATVDFIAEKNLRGLHYICDTDCLAKLSKQVGETVASPAHYFIGTSGLVHWKGGFLKAYAPVFRAIREGKLDKPLAEQGAPIELHSIQGEDLPETEPL